MVTLAGFLAEVKSGKFAIYAQWFSLLSILVMIIVGINQLGAGWGIAGLVFAGTTSLLEISFCMNFLNKDGAAAKTFLFLQKPIARFVYYVVLAIISFAANGYLWLIGLFVSITAACYLLAFFRKEEPVSSSLVGGGGLSSAGSNL